MESSVQFRRLALESLAIVSSILLAFAIDAWWEDSKEEQRRLTLLDDLKSETKKNIEELASTIEAQELQYQQLRTRVRAMLGAEHLSSSRLEELRQQTSTFPAFDPSWGILDLLTASGDLVLLEDSKLRAALANLKARTQSYLANQQSFLDSYTSDIAVYESGTHLYPFVLPENEGSIDNGADLRQLEVALKALELKVGMYANVLLEGGERALEDFQEVHDLLP